MVQKIGFGAAQWGIMFLAVSAIMITPLPDWWQKIIEIVVAGVASYILAMIYFKKHPATMKDAVMLWVIFMIVSAVLDLLITVQYVKANNSYVTGLKMFYGMWSLWLSFVVSLGAIIVASKMNHSAPAPMVMTQPMKTPVMPAVAPTPTVNPPVTPPTNPPANPMS